MNAEALQAVEAVSNPFALLMDPETALAAVERLERKGLKRHICRPLDKPLIPLNGDAAAYDRSVELDD